MKIILLGAPGAGKGTQAEAIKNRLGIPTVSTGSILRQAIKQASPVGIRAKTYVDEGRLVPDDIMVELVRDRLAQPDCQSGYVLDGFPRTIAQALALEEIGIQPDAVVSIEVSDEEIERRLAGRRVCDSCGSTYHIEHHPPRREGVCDACEGELSRRTDDEPETVRARLKVYHDTTEPLKGHYQKKGLLKIIVSYEQIAETTRRVFEILGL